MNNAQKKVYMLTSDDYGDWNVIAIFETRELAEQHMKTLEEVELYNPGYEIEERVLNQSKPAREVVAVVCLETGELKRSYGQWSYEDNINLHYPKEHFLDRNEIHVREKTMDQALKSARDWRAQILAEREGVS